MNRLQNRLQKTLRRENIKLDDRDVLLGIYEQLAEIGHQLARKNSIDKAGLGELASLVLQLCANQGADFDQVVSDYLTSLSQQ